MCALLCVWDADCLLTASAGAGAARCGMREIPSIIFVSLCFRISLSSSHPAPRRAIKFRGAIFINYGMPAAAEAAGAPSLFCFIFRLVYFGLCVFAAAALWWYSAQLGGWAGLGFWPVAASLSGCVGMLQRGAPQFMKKSARRTHTHTHKLS